VSQKFDIINDAPTVARALIERYGVRASCVARWKALWARGHDDRTMMEAWQWVAGAADEMLRAEPE
jgi:hypothetical protein